MRTKTKAAIVAAIMAVAVFAATPAANAGTVTVSPPICNAFNGGASWAGGGGSGWGGGAGCAGSYLYFMPWPGIGYPGGGTVGAAGNYMWIKSQQMPSNTAISSVAYSYLGSSNASGAPTRGVSPCWRPYYSYSHGGMCANQAEPPTLANPGGQWASYSQPMPADTSAIALFAPQSTFPYNWWLWLSGFSANITDNSADTPSFNNGANVTAISGWRRGILPLHTTATDSGGTGVRSQSVTIQPQVGLDQTIASRNTSCDFSAWVPCPEVAPWTTSYNTALTGDGTYTLRMRSTDATQSNHGTTTGYTLKIDNTQPERPGDVDYNGNGENGWSSVDSFDVSWTNGPETVETASRSGISHVVVDIEPESTEATDPAPVVIPIGSTVSGITAAIDSLTGLTFGTPGAYRVGLGLRDLAGNWSSNVQTDSNNAPTGVVIDPDTDPVVGYDPTPPLPPSGQLNGWVSRSELAQGTIVNWSVQQFPERAPICGYARSMSSQQADPGTTINLVGAVNSYELPASLSEGIQFLNLRSVNCAGIASNETLHVEIKVDLTDPTSSATGVTNGKWSKSGTIAQLRGADVLSGMNPAPDNRPAVEGAYIAHALDDASEVLTAGDTANVPVTGDGQHKIVFAPVDFAGNRAPGTTLSFGIDGTAPTTPGFRDQDPARPRLLQLPVADPTSGLESAVIEVRNVAGGDWITLPTSIADSSGAAIGGFPNNANVSATFPDTDLPAGNYLVRVRSYDQAANELATSAKASGGEFVVANPMRSGATVSAGLSKAVRTCGRVVKKKGKKRTVKRRGKCIRRVRGKVVFTGTSPTLSVAWKKGAVVQGFLFDDAGKALAGQPIEIYSKDAKGEILAGNASTRADGSYVFKLKAGASRTVRIVFPGTETRRPASETVKLGTGARVTGRVSKKRVRSGQTVTFRGVVTSADKTMPQGGKLVVLQFQAGKNRWLPAVAVKHTDAKGRFTVKYKFGRTKKRGRIVFRVLAPAEENWGHAASSSHRFTIRIN